jgi:hypothetical protein
VLCFIYKRKLSKFLRDKGRFYDLFVSFPSKKISEGWNRRRVVGVLKSDWKESHVRFNSLSHRCLNRWPWLQQWTKALTSGLKTRVLFAHDIACKSSVQSWVDPSTGIISIWSNDRDDSTDAAGNPFNLNAKSFKTEPALELKFFTIIF